jgi:hypothetical protein
MRQPTQIKSLRPGPAGLAASIQLAPAPWCYKISNADRQARLN